MILAHSQILSSISCSLIHIPPFLYLDLLYWGVLLAFASRLQLLKLHSILLDFSCSLAS